MLLLIWYLIAGLQESTNEVPLWLRNARTSAGIFQASITGLAFIIGGLFAYYRFFKEETYTERLQPSVTTVVSYSEDRYLIQITATVENTGQITVELDEERTYLLLDTRKLGDLDWTEYQPTEIFFNQDAVQPGETISDQIWIELPDNGEVALQTSLGVAKDENLGWEAKAIVNLLDTRGNITDTSDSDVERG